MNITNNPKSLRIFSIILVTLVIVTGTGIGYLLLNKNKSSFSAVNKEVTFSGTIMKVSGCSVTFGGSHCTWLVDNITVDWNNSDVPEEMNKSGSVIGNLEINSLMIGHGIDTGISGSRTDSTDIGKKVKVYGKTISPNHVTIFGKQSYYIKVL
jgi:hypothetical protein